MTWLLKLYPPRWRRRYGVELADIVAAQRFSFGGAIDLLAGAIDAWFHPQLAAAVPDVKGDGSMMARLLQLECAGYGLARTPEDRRMDTLVNIGGTFFLTLVWLALVWTWKLRQLDGREYLMALMPMTFLFPYLVSLRYTSLKGRSVGAQAAVVVALSVVLIVFLVGVGWVTSRW